MITYTITNASSTAAIGAGTTTPLPGPFAWATIAASGSKAFVCRVSDFVPRDFSGFSVADMLQSMVQNSLITVTAVNLAATTKPDVYGDVVSNET